MNIHIQDHQDEHPTRDEFSFLLFNPQVERIRTEASQIESYATALKDLTMMDRTWLRASALNLRSAADILDRLAGKP